MDDKPSTPLNHVAIGCLDGSVHVVESSGVNLETLNHYSVLAGTKSIILPLLKKAEEGTIPTGEPPIQNRGHASIAYEVFQNGVNHQVREQRAVEMWF